ncbi:MAG: hypothetical protein R2879_01160 [Saprospiraceae bacterium]
MLEIFPFIQFLLVSVFVWFGYVAFSSARKFEQNLVWVGMAKETAHQLGTPISAILGWIDHMRFLKEDDQETQEVMDELRNDVTRLELIADRFSKLAQHLNWKMPMYMKSLKKPGFIWRDELLGKLILFFPAWTTLQSSSK